MEKEIHPFESGLNNESARMIAIASGLDGVLGSSMSLNLAICMYRTGKRVCVFQAINPPSDQLLLGYEDTTPSWNAVMGGIVSVEKVVQQGPEGIHVIPVSSQVADYSLLDTQQRQNLLLAFTQLQYDYDYLIVDQTAGFHDATTSFLLDSGSIVLTITPEAETLAQAFSLLRGINQRVFQQPVKVVVNLVAGEIEAKRIIARLSIAIRKYLGSQCGSLSFYIMDERMLAIISDARLVSLDYPDSVPSKCLQDIAHRLMHNDELKAAASVPGHPEKSNIKSGRPVSSGLEDHWLREAIEVIQNAPVEVVEPIMQKLNEIWQHRTRLTSATLPQSRSFELEILKLKTAIHFASQLTDNDLEREKTSYSSASTTLKSS